MSMSPTTVVYYSSNQDYKSFEDAVRNALLEAIGDLPLISVTQQPLDFGHNICIGNVGRSRTNIYQQLRLGAEAADTVSVAVVEADMLYPPGFFTFIPANQDTYYYPKEAYIAWYGQRLFYPKFLHQLTGVVNRLHLLHVLDVLQKPEKRNPPNFFRITMRME